ncbi:bacterial proteasome activator family protein [Kitasatospora sp. NPDC059646]|uniref:bacterial proteasome activator family protein n=1 Tax=Kitasatospora sp. NPDC059646 TaxID=3346893 RepID=UPI0036C3009D
MTNPMNERSQQEPFHASQASSGKPEDSPKVLIVGPDGMAVGTAPAGGIGRGGDEGDEPRELPVTEMVEQPAKVMRIGSMIKQLLEEVRAAPLDEASRARLKEIHASSIKELELGLAPELVEELERLSLPFAEDVIPTEAELRIAQAQLVGWLEGLFHGIQTALFAQQMAARAQLEQMRRALPPGLHGLEGDAEEPAPGRGLRSGPYL